MTQLYERILEDANFEPEDLSYLQQITDLMQFIADVSGADVFIDIPLPDGNAVVLAEAKPATSSTLYQQSVIGLVATANQEPGVAKAHREGIPVMNSQGVSQEGIQLLQNVIPLFSPLDHRVIGSLILERDISSLVAEQEARKQAEEAETRMMQILKVVQDTVVEVKGAMQEIEDISQELAASGEQLAATHNGLAENSQEVQRQLSGLDGILSFISRVSSETHLLGLNAAIEAARVMGVNHGFGVIASEVRKLATHVKESAAEIETIVNGLTVISTYMFDELHETTIATDSQAERLQNLSDQMRLANQSVERLSDFLKH